MIIAVPDFYSREQLGLILGMAQELSIPVKGFVSLPIAASYHAYPNAMLLHLDIHLHRFEIIHLHQGEQLTAKNSSTFQEISLEQLYRIWIETIAEEFVNTTRFDPLHQASTEQELYNRCPMPLIFLKPNLPFYLNYRTENIVIVLPFSVMCCFKRARRYMKKFAESLKKCEITMVKILS